MAADGSHIAVAQRDHRVALHAIATGATTQLEGHRAPVHLVRFADRGDLLVTADGDGHVLLRPRGALGGGDTVRPVEIPSEEIDLAPGA
jgi:hypothetical protein